MKNTKNVIDAAVEIFYIKEKLLNNSDLPFSYQTPIDPNDNTKRGPPFVDLSELPYVIGIVGLNECIQHIFKKQMHESEEAWTFGLKYVFDIKDYVSKLDTPFIVSLARTPAESTAQRFAICDCFNIDDNIRDFARNVVKGDIQQAIESFNHTSDLPIYYSNGTHVDVAANITIFEKIKFEDPFFIILDGGNIFHIFMGEYEPDPAGLMDFCLKVAKNTNISYFVINKNFTGCLDCNWFGGGLLEKCPKCGSDNVEGYARITGYFMPISGWNAGKKAELIRRHQYTEDIG
jgi:ribonucleoside-triphosphate reductase